jgi:hypothetical protein
MAGKAEGSVPGSAPNARDWTSITPNCPTASIALHAAMQRAARGTR